MSLERTWIANREFERRTRPVAYVNGQPAHTAEEAHEMISDVAATTPVMGDPMHDDDPKPVNPFEDNTPIAATCNTEHPELCEACD